jgi:lambda repressor-like predicted transcriptional regulator
MHPEDIKAAIRKRGHTLATVAQRAGKVKAPRDSVPTASAVSRVLHGQFQSRRIAQCISELIGVPLEQLWPGKYSVTGQHPVKTARKVAR